MGTKNFYSTDQVAAITLWQNKVSLTPFIILFFKSQDALPVAMISDRGDLGGSNGSDFTINSGAGNDLLHLILVVM